MISLIIFDLDDTLIDTFSTIKIKTKQVFESLINAGMKVDSKEAALNYLINLVEKSPTGKDALEQFFEHFSIEKKYLEMAFNHYYSVPLDAKIPLIPNAKEVITELNKHHTLAVVTQGDGKVQGKKLNDANFGDHIFVKVIFSATYDKTEHYEKLLEELNVKPENCLVCGDKFNTDLLPAKNLGMKTVHFRWGKGKIFLPKEGQVDYSIDNLNKLKEIVQELK